MILHHGDCLEVLKTLPDNSVDSLVTDPPAGISFMGKKWDDDKGGRKQWVAWMTEVMQECLRVMKPGAHGLVWAIPRTSHWTATALEDAGFEVRDVITHLFGSGFPKSLDISKAIDKAAGVEREVIGLKHDHEKRSRKYVNPGWDRPRLHDDSAILRSKQVTAPTTEAAKQWQGFGTALKPASEHWILIRKPISEKTVAANVLKWGVGGINIDGCRIEAKDHPGVHHAGSSASGSLNWNSGDKKDSSKEYYIPKGRFPANLVLSHNPDCEDDQCSLGCAVAMLDAQSGTLKTGGSPATEKNRGKYGKNGMFAQGKANISSANFSGDSGGASRFFYCAKTSTSERNAGLGNGTNNHPTVKAQKLMRYLCRLITPPNGIVLDPFMGSGSTGVAAKSEGFEFIGIEQNLEYLKIAECRLKII